MEITKIKVRLAGLADIMFDRFFDHSKEKRPPEQKFYLAEGNKVIFPSTNIKEGFLFGKKPEGCAAMFEGKQRREYITWGKGHVHIDPQVIQFLDAEDKPVVFDNFDNGRFYVYSAAPRDAKGGKMEVTHRPVLRIPWALAFEITVVENPKVTVSKLHNWFLMGGLQLGLGNGRPSFGRFAVDEWEEI